MLTPKPRSIYNGRPSFVNPTYLKKAQSEKPCLYDIPYDKDDLANIFAPDKEETLTLEQDSRSKLHKATVKPYDYTKQNSLNENFKPPTQKYLDQLWHINETRKKMWRRTFVKYKPNIAKNIRFLPTQESISKSRQTFNVITNNINHFKEIVDLDWHKHMYEQWRQTTMQDMTTLLKNLLIPLENKSRDDAFNFVHELKQEMFADLEYVRSLEKEVDELELEEANFSNEYDLLLQECVSKDIMCSYLHSLLDLDEQAQLQYLKDQLQDKNIAISELKKLIEKMKGKSMDTKFDKPSVVRQPNAQRILISVKYTYPYGYIKNHKKIVKNKQARTRERKSEQKPEAKPEKVKPTVNSSQIMVNKSQQDPKCFTLAPQLSEKFINGP
ncbi:hypothetical protein Tco_1152706 [Tanacetum coccineum]